MIFFFLVLKIFQLCNIQLRMRCFFFSNTAAAELLVVKLTIRSVFKWFRKYKAEKETKKIFQGINYRSLKYTTDVSNKT